MDAPTSHTRESNFFFFFFLEWPEKERSCAARLVLREALEFTLHLPFQSRRLEMLRPNTRSPSFSFFFLCPSFVDSSARAPRKNDRDISYTYEPLKFLPKAKGPHF